ncbi:hypothetical protein PE066_09575 [Ramlibacter tataouinensis]|uniref:hypothetical protein n=1 Tax=Ramlibacter tataouinensis TaxID=94132 RepID=UPI0022F3FD37|nr:hypothetical protein [Ramlibacter tataouinensis]WBY03759.1 hypothetical protein PE066_09575 [Ramlibacter tataouinensis]
MFIELPAFSLDLARPDRPADAPERHQALTVDRQRGGKPSSARMTLSGARRTGRPGPQRISVSGRDPEAFAAFTSTPRPGEVEPEHGSTCLVAFSLHPTTGDEPAISGSAGR